MNQNTEYERFTQEIYQQLVDSDVVKATTVQHNVKLIGRSGQKHQKQRTIKTRTDISKEKPMEHYLP